ncbi:MAG TPA: HisA/HisF-related TIM barrel protein [Methanospirillum sp.]|nr:HisA/HisF-related TIM barrel protein [Methanospirillum sp.]
MDLILAADLKAGQIVHGKSGQRDEYRPVKTPLASTAEPFQYIREIRPRYLYVADLDRITGTGDHDAWIPNLAGCVDLLLLDRGCQGPSDMLVHDRVINIIGTETAGKELSLFSGGYLSVDMKGGIVIPKGQDPITLLDEVAGYGFEGCILLDIGGVGTSRGLDSVFLDRCRSAYPGRLLWGGGVATMEDLYLLNESDYDGAIIATALHTGAVPIDLIQRGRLC